MSDDNGSLVPLDEAYFKSNPKSFSAQIVDELRNSAFFQPKLRKDGRIQEKEMLLIAATVIAASDRHIKSIEDSIGHLQERVQWWNSPLFQTAVADAGPSSRKPPGASADESGRADDDPDKREASWFAQHLTLRNVLGATVILSSAVWAVFTWYSSDKNAAVQRLESALQIAEERHKRSEEAHARTKDDFNKYRADYKSAEARIDTLERDRGRLLGRLEEQKASLETARRQNATLVNGLEKCGTRAP